MSLPIPTGCDAMQRELELAKKHKDACLRDGYDNGYYVMVGRIKQLEAALKEAHSFQDYIATT